MVTVAVETGPRAIRESAAPATTNGTGFVPPPGGRADLSLRMSHDRPHTA